MDMSRSSSALDNDGWEKFISTGSIYDYLDYKFNNENTKKSVNRVISPDDGGDFCENRSKWNSDKRG